MATKRVYRRAAERDVKLDLTSTITPQYGKSGGRELIVPFLADSGYQAFFAAAEAPLRPHYGTLSLPIERYSVRRQEQEVVKTETWGDDTVEYVETWDVTLTWLGIKHDGAKIT